MKSIRSKHITIDFIIEAIKNCFKHKYHRNDVCKFISSYTDGELSTEEVKMIAKNQETRELLYFYYKNMAIEFYDEIINQTLHFDPLVTSERVDNSSGKVRLISVESIKQQIFDYICVNMLHDIFKNRLGTYQCASIPNRGQIYALKAINKWKQNVYRTQYFVKTDVTNYFHSIDHQKIYDMVYKYAQNEQLMYVIGVILNTYENGLSIGSYLSQYLANLFLSDVYRELTENYIITRRNKSYRPVKHMIIYMDDIIMFTHNKKDAKYALNKLTELISLKGLSIHNTIIMKFENDTYIDVAGYKIYRNRVVMRKRNYNRIRKLVINTRRRKYKIKDRYSIVSYNGVIIHCDSFKIAKRLGFTKLNNSSKNVISDIMSI